MSDYQVAVIGGGTAGVVATIQAGRAGARTLLVEKNGLLGGTMVAAAVNFPGLFHAWGRQIISGIGWELVCRCIEEAGGILPDFTTSPKGHWEHQVRINAPLYAALCDEAVRQAGVELLLHMMIAGARRANGRWVLSLCGKEGLCEVTAGVVVDCTGDACAARLAGVTVRQAPPDQLQPGSLHYRLGGYDLTGLDLPGLQAAAERAVSEGQLLPTDLGWSPDRPNIRGFLSARDAQPNHIMGIAGADSAGKTAMELAGRASMLRVLRFLRAQPGLEDVRVALLPPECGVRETVTIDGRECITAEDYTSGRLWPDAVCYSFYPIDLHSPLGKGLDVQPLRQGVAPTVPRGALLPRGVDALVVAGRCISSDRLANSALRVQATCMATGQAAGALAALAARMGGEASAVPMDSLRHLLREHRAIVPDESAQGG
jgi:hypothetical protein